MKPFAPAKALPARFLPRFWADRSGANALEFALVSPAMLFMIVAIVQLGLALHKGSTVQWAAENAVREAMLDADLTAADLQTAIQARLLELGDNTQVAVNYALEEGEVVSIGRIEVTYDYPIYLPLMDQINARFTVDTRIPVPAVG